MANLYGTSPADPWRMEGLDDDEALHIAVNAAEDDGSPVALLDQEGWWLVSPQGGEPEYLYGERDERRLLALGIALGEEERAALYPQRDVQN